MAILINLPVIILMAPFYLLFWAIMAVGNSADYVFSLVRDHPAAVILFAGITLLFFGVVSHFLTKKDECTSLKIFGTDIETCSFPVILVVLGCLLISKAADIVIKLRLR